jgi:lysyl-tRNA synthetase class 2
MVEAPTLKGGSEDPPVAWRPSSSISVLKQRANILATIRDLFHLRQVMEVETPALSLATVTDPHLDSISCQYTLLGDSQPRSLYLQTSPEYAMKRLLAAGSGPIYQISKAFRFDSAGRYHNPEFTMLEWYRPGFSHRDLMIEMDALLRKVLQCEIAQCVTYAELFQQYCGLDPHHTSVAALQAFAKQQGLQIHQAEAIQDLTTWLQLLMQAFIEPHLGFDHRPTFVTDFPAAQAALAKIDPGPPAVAERFEVYWRGMELANGFHELLDPQEQRRRLEADNAWRAQHGKATMPIDERFLAALAHGLPACAGVALGIDRLVMAALSADSLADVLTFPIDRA